MAFCSATATIKKDAKGNIVFAYITCPPGRTDCPGDCRKGSRTLAAGDLIKYEIHFCYCSHPDADPPIEPAPIEYCHLEMLSIFKRDKKTDPYPLDPQDARVYCGKGCASGKCPDQPKPKETKGGDGSVTYVYDCECG
jgi:hypothetical protein